MTARLHGLSMALVVACLAVASTVHASLLDGQTVATTNFHGTAPETTLVIGPVESVVGPGVELTDFGWSGFVRIDFSDTNILITLTIDQPFGYFELLRFVDSKGTIPAFTGVTINPATNYEGFDASRVSFDADRIDVNLTALPGLKGQQISLDLTPGPGPGAGPRVAGHIDLQGIPLAGSEVILRQPQSPIQSTTTDVDGQFAFATLVSGERFSVGIRGPVMGPGGASPAVAGCVEMDAAPLSGRRAMLGQPGERIQSTTTDGAGCYVFATAVSGKAFGVVIRGPIAP